MALRKCSSSEALKAAQAYGCANEHEFKSHVVGNTLSISTSDIFINGTTREIFIANKDGSNPQSTGVKI